MADLDQLTRDATRLLDREAKHQPEADGELVTPLPGLILLRHRARTGKSAAIYEPIVCLILQGAKETTHAGQTIRLGAGTALIVSHTSPVLSQITEAAPGEPYVAMVLQLDLRVLRSLYEELGGRGPTSADAEPFSVGPAAPDLIDAMTRYVALAARTTDAAVLGPLVLKEIHYRLLVSPQGEMLHRLMRHDSHESTIAHAIAQIRNTFKQKLSISDLARQVHMSQSSFHEHFRKITSTTPLQFQKELRLQDAQRQLRAGGCTVAAVALDVGYESPNQFSREYTRKFGVAPQTELNGREAPGRAREPGHLEMGRTGFEPVPVGL